MMRPALALAFTLFATIADAQDSYPNHGLPQEQAAEAARNRPERVVAGLSHDDVDITTNFSGSNIIIYGAVKRETAIPKDDELDVIVTVAGPPEAVTVRRKERKFGIWMNTESVQIGAAPDFYAVATTRPLWMILPPAEDERYRISIPLAIRAFAGKVTVENTAPFTSALVDLREKGGEYRLSEGTVHLVEDTLFRADVSMPANLIEGKYTTRIFLLRDGKVIDTHRATIDVRKVGLERWLFRLSRDEPLAYGLMSLLFAVGAGWLASTLFRSIKRA